MQLKSWSRKQFKKFAKKDAWELTKHPCFAWNSTLEYGYETATLLSKSGKVLMCVTFHVALDEPIIEIASSKYWKGGVNEEGWMYDNDPSLLVTHLGERV